MWKCWLTCVKVWSVLKLNAHNSYSYMVFIPWPWWQWWQWPNLRGWFSQLRKLCDVLTGVTDAGVGWSHFPVWRQGDRLLIYSYFWYSCAERGSSLHMEPSFSPGMGGWVCSVTLLGTLLLLLLCSIAVCLMWQSGGIYFNGKDSGIEGEAVGVQPVTPGSEVPGNRHSHWKAEVWWNK